MTFQPKLKRCCRCLKAKPLYHFTKKSKSPDGLNYRCRACERIYQDQYRKMPGMRDL